MVNVIESLDITVELVFKFGCVEPSKGVAELCVLEMT